MFNLFSYLFKKHNLTVVGFCTHADPPTSENTLVYILAHDSREAAKKNWAAFMADPVRKGLGRDRKGRADQHEGRIRLPQPDRLFANQVRGRTELGMGFAGSRAEG